MPYFPDFAQTARLGFQSGMQMGEGQNPLGTFIRAMLADWQQRRAMETEYGMKKGLLEEEYKLKSKYPDPLMAILAKQYGIDISEQGVSTTGDKTDLGVTGLSFGKTGARIELGETPSQKQGRELKTKQLERGQQAREEMNAVDAMANSIWSSSNELIPAPEKPSEAEKIGIRRKATTFSIGGIRPQRVFGITDENALAFSQAIKAEATPFMRALGEKGMMTNQDIQRGLELMPNVSDSKQSRTTKKRQFSDFIKSKIKAYYQENDNQNPIIQQTQRKANGQLMIDAQGNRAIVYPDGTYEEVQ